MNRLIKLSPLFALLLPIAAATAQPVGPITDYLVLPPVVRYDKSPVHADPIDAAIAQGTWRAPAAGQTVAAAEGEQGTWSSAKASSSGELRTPGLAGGYAFATVESDTERVMLLRATRHAAVRVNDAWLAGDPYGLGFVELPVLLREGTNELLFHVGPRRGMRAELVTPPADFALLTADAVLPDVVRGEGGSLWGAVPIVNARTEPLIGARVATKIGSNKPIAIDLPRIEPLTVYKMKFRFDVPNDLAGDKVELRVAVVRSAETSAVSAQADPEEAQEVDEAPDAEEEPADAEQPKEIEVLARDRFSLKVVAESQLTSRTFVSRVDGSVQRYAVLPAIDQPEAEETSTILTLHDSGVDCRDHAARYGAKTWAHVVAPQGRRGHAFDWEGLGEADALEALADAAQHYPANPRRTCLTGVGVGGHGAWLIGARDADRFAAIAPINGWLSYWSRGVGMPSYADPTRTQAMLTRVAAESDTLAILSNLKSAGVYLQHDADGRYVAQGRFARRRLADFHSDFVYQERNAVASTVIDEATGGAVNPVLDGPGLMGFFQRSEAPKRADIKQVDFTTVWPAGSAGVAWARVEAQQQPFKPSRLALLREGSTFSGRTENVARLSLQIAPLREGGPRKVSVRLDGSPKIEADPPGQRRGETTRRLWFTRQEDGRWQKTPPPRDAIKTAQRSGGFKNVFDRDPLLVYGTAGNEEENRWAESKARYDAQVFWVRGGGSLEVMPDTAFNSQVINVNRSVVLYGNADTNRAWPNLLSSSPVQVRNDQVYVGVRPELGNDVGVLMARPRSGSRTALVGVVGGSGIAGMRLTNRLRYFFPGIGYPDLMLIGPRGPREGAAGVRTVGSFGHDWSLETGDVAWRDLAL